MSKEIMQQALDALKYHQEQTRPIQNTIEAIEALEAALAQPEQAPFKPDWVSYRQGVADGAAQPEQEEPLPLVDMGVDVTPEGTHVVACYNRPDAVQEMFYSQFHPLAKPEQKPKLSDAGVDTNIPLWGLEPKGKGMVTLHQPNLEHQPWCDYLNIVLTSMPPQRANCNCKTAQPEQEPVAWMLPDYGDVLSASEADGTGIYNIPLYTAPPKRKWIGLTEEEIKKIMQRWRGEFDIRDIERLLKDKNT